MSNHKLDTVTETLNDLKQRGYTLDFNLKPTCLECPQLQLELHPEDFDIDEVHRFEGMSNPDDNAVLYAISSKDGKKGVLLDAYGTYGGTVSPEMLAKLETDYRK
ncbi:MAG: phosphoribosylpyrophosphate synthetase [Hymenobacteraceae bacterium]|nr:phosphoribosylpyrophosphate synthetase [Hymenobacteraceae bacterium]MDX5396429.1 phosphoribosylpyrophosphate synthetase [Hymenobacteraceae bacterium]MDX5442575.1 phosphoribosylpyrophosphate synthetase [Hymenobacteraceae bacterium]MDX5512490.1 phosphoribosylpyrophosphate synthetase [Hymenobacteraceae bacterium]